MADSFSPHNDAPFDAGDDLLWQAFRYVAGEMSDDEMSEDEMSEDEIEAFEVELTENTRACEAVARVVQLRQAVVIVERDRRPEPVAAKQPVSHFDQSHREPSHKHQRTRSTVAVVAALMVALGGGIWFAVRWVERQRNDHQRNEQRLANAPQRPLEADAADASEAVDLVALWRNPAHPALAAGGATSDTEASAAGNESADDSDEGFDDDAGWQSADTVSPGDTDPNADPNADPNGDPNANTDPQAGAVDVANGSPRGSRVVVARAAQVPDWLLVALEDVSLNGATNDGAGPGPSSGTSRENGTPDNNPARRENN